MECIKELEKYKGDLIKELAREIIIEIDEKRFRERRKKKLHNTKLLMNNYKALKENAWGGEQKNKYNRDSEEDGILIESIIKTKMRTIKMLSYIDNALKSIENNLKKNNETYKFIAFKKFYFEKKSIEQISEECNCSVMSIRRWNNCIIDELSLILWGVDSLDF